MQEKWIKLDNLEGFSSSSRFWEVGYGFAGIIEKRLI